MLCAVHYSLFSRRGPIFSVSTTSLIFQQLCNRKILDPRLHFSLFPFNTTECPACTSTLSQSRMYLRLSFLLVSRRLSLPSSGSTRPWIVFLWNNRIHNYPNHDRGADDGSDHLGLARADSAKVRESAGLLRGSRPEFMNRTVDRRIPAQHRRDKPWLKFRILSASANRIARTFFVHRKCLNIRFFP